MGGPRQAGQDTSCGPADEEWIQEKASKLTRNNCIRAGLSVVKRSASRVGIGRKGL